MDAALWDGLLSTYVTHGQFLPGCQTVASHIADMPTGTLEEQLVVLCSLPNNHWSTLLTKKYTKVNYVQHLLYNPDSHEDDNGVMRLQYQPPSPRNQILLGLFNWADDDHTAKVYEVMRSLVNFDNKEQQEKANVQRLIALGNEVLADN